MRISTSRKLNMKMKQQQKAGHEDDAAARKSDMRMKQQQKAGQEDEAAAKSRTGG